MGMFIVAKEVFRMLDMLRTPDVLGENDVNLTIQ